MIHVQAISEPVQFDHHAANDLITSFRATAAELDREVAFRNQIARIAEQDWQGAYAIAFRGRMQQCVADTRMLADSMRHAANEVERLSKLAHQEQNRRDLAAEYFQRQDERNVLEKGWDRIFGEDPPPPLQPISPSTVDVAPLHHITGRV